ncbi:glycoside hydrolase family 53 protein [Sphingobacterium arenae]|uniref:Arabinogalactan endo-beta-1,4-galactanase n=1 Tax=Sphingobacterium arenae TaxID=1280598 RepID=A0ABR7Y7R4_9SPHI|nr:glycosyl hydrolase 53 family protein [Sphingobacterium arenae]MBD1427342.1 glycosyl hydrolase 53 family protein [Sphingobacterium arenae]
MNAYIKRLSLLWMCIGIFGLGSCKDDHAAPATPDQDSFAKGADISWITEMEAAGLSFYNQAGMATDGLKLLRSLGMNAVRLRVWVDPTNGWCNKEDVLVKAYRAHHLGMRIMVDFHYSDHWADPGQQNKPAAWESLSLDELKAAVAEHTKEVLQLLKDNGMTAEWVQVGNETGNGMLWADGKASENMANYAALNNAGYDAVKAVFPEAKVIVHVHNGYDNGLFRWLFDGLKSNGGRWDVIGMSLYPNADNWKELTQQCVENMQDMIGLYETELMICEVGMSWDEEEAAAAFLTELIDRSRQFPDGQVLGVFYWEPLAYGSWNGYTLGAMDDSGRPTKALEVFK